MTIFAERLKTLRESRGLMQKSVAAELNIGNTTLSNYEKNVSSPNPDILVAIADYFDTSTDFLLGRTENPSPAETVVGDADKHILTTLDKLTPEEKASVIEYADFLLAKHKK